MRTRRAALPALALALAPVLAACGSPDRLLANPEAATPIPTGTVRPTVFPSKSPTSAPTTAAPTATETTPATTAPPAGGGNAVKALPSNAFDPKTLTVKVGTKVTWTNEGGFHTVTGGKDGTKDPASPMNGTLATQGATYEVTFTKPGSYPYYCEPHESLGMVGEIVVQ